MNLSDLTTELRRASDLWGLIVYEIDSINGTLNGSWTNNDQLSTLHNPIIMNEIARKRDGQPENILGTYSVAYIESNNQSSQFIGELTITETRGVYNLDWRIGNSNHNNNFSGVGMKTGEKQLTVFYWAIN